MQEEMSLWRSTDLQDAEMFNILYEEYPSALTIENHSFRILTDFRDWISFSEMIMDPELKSEDKILLAFDWFTDEKPDSAEKMIKAMGEFFSFDFKGKKTYNRQNTGHSKRPVFSFAYDGIYVLADFRRYYNIELKTVNYMHWWEFRALFLALPDDSETRKRIGYRSMKLNDIKDKEERRRIRKIQRDIMIPVSDTLSDEDIGEILSTCV